MVATAIDYFAGFSQLFATKLGIESIHIAFPASAAVYGIGAVVVECLYRLTPLGILMWAVMRWLPAGARTPVFWALAILTSLVEPMSQAGLLLQDNLPMLIGIGGFTFGFNLLEAWLLRRHGIASPIVARIAFYMVWHVALGPLVA